MFILILISMVFLIFFSKIYLKYSMAVCKSNVCLVGKTILITGGTSGLGFATAVKLAARGCNLVIADIADGEESVKKIVEETGNCNIRYKYLDVGDFQCVRRFCEEFLESEERLDVLINNAGIGHSNELFNPDGCLKIMAVNYYGAFLLTHLLINLIKKTPRSRVVFVSSCLAFIHNLENPKDLNKSVIIKTTYLNTFQQYGITKFCMLVASNLLAKKGIHANSVYPGYVHTPMHNKTMSHIKSLKFAAKLIIPLADLSVFLYSKSASEGAETILDASISKEMDGVRGEFLYDCKPHRQPRKALDEEFCRIIWEETEKIVGLTEEEKIK